MNNNAPVLVTKPMVLEFCGESHKTEPDLDMLEIEEAKRHFDDRNALEAFWAGRTLADRKSARVAA